MASSAGSHLVSMLFTTAQFALLFLPLTLLGFFIAGRSSHRAAAAWLLLASLFFYSWWMPVFTLLLLASIGSNFAFGLRIARAGARSVRARRWLVLGIVFNLSLLGYFKYANFFVDSVDALLGLHWQLGRVILPIGISFYSFTQLAYLVDTYKGKVNEAQIIHYGLFVTYFPHLIAGPVLHHAQMMPQFADAAIYRINGANLAAGLAIFALGLVKKVVLADGVAPYADAVFNPVDGGSVPDLAEAWLGALAYTFQLYFDFSGYSDMAIGLSLLFNVRLPFNFDSPYKATSISDFWRRWHITLSTFLRDYLYIALGGNRHGSVRRYFNLAVTMVLGGLWHGASWSFVIWGALHGLYLMVNHAFRAACGAALCRRLDDSRIFGLFGWALTMLAVVLAWVLFRATSLDGAGRMLQGMVGLTPSTDVHPLLWNAGLHAGVGAGWCAVLAFIACLLPNSNRIGQQMQVLAGRGAFRSGWLGGAALAATLLLVVLNAARDSVSAFIYFNF